jgi:2-polyprenyl-3-methyl-5-hydroxy-6-metoxy-1,4-benzoquinol methylase
MGKSALATQIGGNPGGAGTADVPQRALRRLARPLARGCRGRTALVTAALPELDEALRERGVEAVEAHFPGPPVDTVVVAGRLEYERQEEAPHLLHDAWQRLSRDGRLVVCVANEDCGADPRHVQRFTRRSLHRLLRPFGRPRLVTGQPYRWLVMTVDARRRATVGEQERYRVIAGLCRGSVLELGCGSGELCAAVARRGLPCTGIDRSGKKIEQARRWHSGPGLEFAQGDILELDLRGRRYDTVLLSEVLEHVEDETGLAMLLNAWRALAPGGRLIVSVPNEDCVPHPNHVREFRRCDLAKLLRRFGRPRLVTDQPFRYLLMFVRKPGDAPAG